MPVGFFEILHIGPLKLVTVHSFNLTSYLASSAGLISTLCFWKEMWKIACVSYLAVSHQRVVRGDGWVSILAPV